MPRLCGLPSAVASVLLLSAQSGGQPSSGSGVETADGPPIQLVFLGTYSREGSKGVYACRFDSRTGKLSLTGETGNIPNPSFLCVDRTGSFLYSTSETPPRDGQPGGAIHAFRIANAKGLLVELNSAKSHGKSVCHVSVDRTRQVVVAANYSTGNIVSLPIEPDGSLAEAASVIQHEGKGAEPRRQAGPHAHSVTIDPTNRFALAADLGTDRVETYRIDHVAGTLTHAPDLSVSLPPGSGPRHLAFHPRGTNLYVVNELSNTVDGFSWSACDGVLTHVQTISTLPEGFAGTSYCADIHLSADGRFLYASNRGHNSIAVFSVDAATGVLEFSGTSSCGGDWPRNFSLDPTGSWLLAANQKSNNVVVFKIDAETGRLGAAVCDLSVPVPVCIAFSPPRSDRGVRGCMGGGNFTNGKVDDDTKAKFRVLTDLGVGMCRVNLYPQEYIRGGDWTYPREMAMDEVMAAAHNAGVTPMVLFEYYAKYYSKEGFGKEEDWFGIGRAFALRYRPNGEWAAARGIRDYGVTVYTAMNEPEGTAFGKGGSMGPEPYVAALRGLGNGVHSVDPDLIVAPGGFKNPNARCDWELDGIGPEIAPLYNAGILDAIDLHTYYDVEYAPMEKGYRWSAQNNFNQVKRANGIRPDILFLSTEFNYKRRLVTEDEAAAGFLTGIWDNLGVVGNDGRTRVSFLAFPWNIFQPLSEEARYGLCVTFKPWYPSSRGSALHRVLELTEGLHFISLDPTESGMFVLDGDTRKVWVWQNRDGWTTHAGTRVKLTAIPPNIVSIKMFGWNGLRREVEVFGKRWITVDGLPENETLMFVAEKTPKR